ncbi:MULTISPECIES: hypothetical protein [Bacillus]|uniref:hypothetical protein n=1 Tax=Bacillus TaxID=1386 RepID=UPI000BFA504F|nr:MULTISPECIES: hypothetical protein [Bacillus]KAF6700422.1 hypothetical protein HFD78_09875 [Bacillus sp. EKM501B]PFS08401.1 hypothetical protein COK60_01585 [Bacillus thuringiensis]
MEPTIIAAFTGWVINGVVAGVTANLTYDTMKHFKAKFINKFSGFFNNEEQAEEYLKCIGDTPSRNINKPFRDVEDSYELIVKKELPDSFIPLLKEWILENKEELNKIATKNNNTLNIGSQTAGRDVINVQGHQTINNYGGNNGSN